MFMIIFLEPQIVPPTPNSEEKDFRYHESNCTKFLQDLSLLVTDVFLFGDPTIFGDPT